MDSKTIRESGRNAQGVRLLHMEPGERVAAAVVLAPEEEANGSGGRLLQWRDRAIPLMERDAARYHLLLAMRREADFASGTFFSLRMKESPRLNSAERSVFSVAT